MQVGNSNYGEQLLGLTGPIVKAACRRRGLRADEPDLGQEVATRLLYRIQQHGWAEVEDRYIRRTAFLDANKLCEKFNVRRRRESCVDLTKLEHRIKRWW